jgi:hypothetical protein
MAKPVRRFLRRSALRGLLASWQASVTARIGSAPPSAPRKARRATSELHEANYMSCSSTSQCLGCGTVLPRRTRLAIPFVNPVAAMIVTRFRPWSRGRIPAGTAGESSPLGAPGASCHLPISPPAWTPGARQASQGSSADRELRSGGDSLMWHRGRRVGFRAAEAEEGRRGSLSWTTVDGRVPHSPFKYRSSH